MLEVEIKARCEHETVRPRLVAIGFDHAGTIHQVDHYLNAPTKDLAVTDEALRVRATTESATSETDYAVTYKGPRLSSGVKTRQEVTVETGSLEEMVRILTAIGCKRVGIVEKRRERYTRDETTVALDTVMDLGEFIEIERTESTDRSKDAQAAVEAVLDELDIDAAARCSQTYLDMVLDDNS